MLDQMFTADNFRRVYDSENRKGLDLAKKFFPGLEPFTEDVRAKVQDIRELRRNRAAITSEDFDTKLATLRSELGILKSKKSNAVDAELEKVFTITFCSSSIRIQ